MTHETIIESAATPGRLPALIHLAHRSGALNQPGSAGPLIDYVNAGHKALVAYSADESLPVGYDCPFLDPPTYGVLPPVV